MESYKCPICGNSDNRYVGIRKGKPYCRKCITFRGQEAAGEYVQNDSGEYTLHYELSDDQKRLSKQLVENYKRGIDSLVHAVCGSGKTEIVMKVISYCLKNNQKIGFTIPRRDVVIELSERFKKVFVGTKIISVYGGMTELVDGNFICLTTHQLFRYNKYFDLLIIDEIDAFPYKGNEVLNAFFQKSIKRYGRFIMLSATPSKTFITELRRKGVDVLELNARFHNKPLPVPKIILKSKIGILLFLIEQTERYLKEKKQVFIFTPTIEICEKTYSFLKFLVPKGACLHSRMLERGRTIENFKAGKTKYLVTTSVLERGVTVKNVQVIVCHADHSIYDQYSLVQIAGRVGRKIDSPFGDVIFLAKKKTKEMENAISDIKSANSKKDQEKHV